MEMIKLNNGINVNIYRHRVQDGKKRAVQELIALSDHLTCERLRGIL